MKKAQSMSIQTIVVAILALIVLIIIVLIMTGRFSFFTQSTGTCESQGGVCASSLGGSCNSDFPIMIWADGCSCIKDNPSDSTDKSCEGKKNGQCCRGIAS